jgi:hypothetical protein
MTVERLALVLHDTIDGLTALDAERLEKLERELAAEAAAGSDSLFAERDARKEDALRVVMATHRLLGSLLASTAVNLSVLEGLRRRNDLGDGRWGR